MADYAMLPGFESVPAGPIPPGRFFVRDTYRRARLRGLARGRALDPRRVLGVAMEREVQNRLADLGYTAKATSHKAHFDLTVSGVRVEVKASTWDGQRYQFNLRAGAFDVLVVGCLGADDLEFFVIPADLVAGRSYVKITSEDPAAYRGRFSAYRGAWGLLDEMIKARANTGQLSLWGEKCTHTS